ncbi:chymotrypsin-1-like [Periplaneta americana]|uniref:chymotrypsin-1-like n=1 Tax=Periplaneta americana TaxID=6978 RepID=UPI0037E851BB
MKQYILLLVLCINPDFSSAEEAQYPLQPRIIGGRNATKNEFPFVVAILVFGKPQCTGTIINQYKVLTVAHCVLNGTDYDDYIVKAGFYIANDPNAIVRNVNYIRIHFNYEVKQYWTFDIAILNVTQPFVFNEAVQPVVLPKFRRRLRPGTKATIIGWGYTQFAPRRQIPSVLQALDLTYIKKSECRQSWRLVNRTICAVAASNSQASCRGDSGSPMMVGNVQWGILATGTTNCTGRRPFTFLEVSRFTKWIKRVSMVPGQGNRTTRMCTSLLQH